MPKVAIPGPGKCRGRPARTITDKQQAFIAEYAKDTNGARAARAAGYRHPAVAAAKLLSAERYPHVVAEVRRRLAEKRQVCALEGRELLEELAKIAFFNPKALFEGGKPVPLHELPDDVAGAVAQWDVRETVEADGTRVREVRFRGHNKPAALRLMAVLLGYRPGPPGPAVASPRPARSAAPPDGDPACGVEMTPAELREAVLSLVRAAGAGGAPAVPDGDDGPVGCGLPSGLAEGAAPDDDPSADDVRPLF
jgi:phage terminase small subunit